MSKRYYTPVLLALLSLISGIYLQSIVPQSFWPLVGGFAGSLLLVLIGFLFAVRLDSTSLTTNGSSKSDRPERSRRVRSGHLTLVYGAVALMFVTGGALSLHLQKVQHAHTLAPWLNKNIFLVGSVTDKDEWNEGKGDVLRVHVHQVRPEGEDFYKPVNFNVLSYSKKASNAHVGDTVFIKKVIIRPPTFPAVHGNPTYNDFLLKENLIAALFLMGSWQCRVLTRPDWNINRWLWDWRHTVYKKMEEKLSPVAQQYCGLMFLGNKQQPSIDSMRTAFNRWGLAHYLARSGLHIVLFIIMWTLLLRLVPIHLRFKRLLLILLCIAYDLLSWSSIPFARAYYVFLLMQAGHLLGRAVNFLHLLTLTCLVILLLNPMQLFFLDFQLSFALTFTLVFFAHILDS